jgi:hypothetical protein
VEVVAHFTLVVAAAESGRDAKAEAEREGVVYWNGEGDVAVSEDTLSSWNGLGGTTSVPEYKHLLTLADHV